MNMNVMATGKTSIIHALDSGSADVYLLWSGGGQIGYYNLSVGYRSSGEERMITAEMMLNVKVMELTSGTWAVISGH